jgi:nucleoside-diphosphate-sugar epimerase
LIRISGLNVDIRQDASRMRPAEVAEIYGSYERAKRNLGWEPQPRFEESLESIFRYWLDRIL